MKRMLLSAAMLLSSLLTFAQFSGSGSGTESDPFLILNPIQLNQLRNFLNRDGVYFKLMANIDLTEFLEDENPLQGWQPVGNSSAKFKGVLDGNGKTITGLWVERSGSDYVGLFGFAENAVIKNFTLQGEVSGRENVALLLGRGNSVTISDCVFEGNIAASSYAGGCAGGGYNITINNCVFKGDVAGTSNLGGLVGYVEYGDNNINGCSYSSGKITATGDNIGGICGYAKESGNITNCNSTGDIKGMNQVGGICGNAEGIQIIGISRCSYYGNIYATSNVGGILGKLQWDEVQRDRRTVITSCCVIGNCIATGDNVGGIIGNDYGLKYFGNSLTTEISDCYFSGAISGSSSVGGLIGYKNYGSMTKSYCKGTIEGRSYVGGILGRKDQSVDVKKVIAINTHVKATESNVGRIVGGGNGGTGTMGTADESKAYNRTIVTQAGVALEITDDDSKNGTSVSATTLKLKATYVAMGWDFNDTWEIQETECYPYFKRQTAPPVITSQLVSGATTISGKCVDGGLVTLDIDGMHQEMISTNHQFSFTVSPLQAGREVRISAKVEGKDPSYFTTETVAYLGKGTKADPYRIYTAADLTGVYRRGYFKLMNDIDLTDYINQFSPAEGWQSIGREGSETIHLDGDGHKITGLWCNSTRDNIGLFSCFANGTIKNLTVETADGKLVKGGSNTGILIGKMINGTIENCRVLGAVASENPVGGMVGLFDGGRITQCQATVTIDSSKDNSYVGGLAGLTSNSEINKCIAIVTLQATGKSSYVGGIVGKTTDGTITQCSTSGSLQATGSESYVGGLVGDNSSAVTDCYSSANVTSSFNAAGLIAYNRNMVDKCYAEGDIFSHNYAAGIIGYNDGSNAIIQNCAAMNNRIEIRYESQQVDQGGGYGMRVIGGIKNGAPAPEMNNYALNTMQVSVNDVPQKVYDDIMNGTAKTEAELMQKATYQLLGWNFYDVWTIDEEKNYPYQNLKTDSSEDPEMPVPPLTIDNSGYATYCSSKSLDFSGLTDIKAFIASGFNPSADMLLLTQVTKVPAGEGLFIIGNPGTYDIPEGETDMVYFNMMKGVLTPQTITHENGTHSNFVLMDGDLGTYFYPVVGMTTIAANTAYLQLPMSVVSANVKAISFTEMDEAVRIDDLNKEGEDIEFYDLNGIRQSTMHKGVNIVRMSDGTVRKVMKQ